MAQGSPGVIRRLVWAVAGWDDERWRLVTVGAAFVVVLLAPPYRLTFFRALAQAIGLVGAGVLLWRRRAGRRRGAQPGPGTRPGAPLPGPLVAVIAAIVAVSLLGCLVAAEPARAFRYFYDELFEHLVIVLVLLWLARPGDYRRFLVVIAGVVVVLSVIGVIGYFTGGPVYQDDYLGKRASSVFPAHGRAALYIGRWTPALAALALTVSATRWQAAAWAGVAVAYAFVLLTFTRTVYIGLPVALAVLLWWQRRRLLGLALIIGFLIAAAVMPAKVAWRFGTLTEVVERPELAGDRLPLWRSTLAMAMDHPVLGIGHGWHNFQRLYPLYRLPEARTPVLWNAHNLYLELLVEGGAVGILPYVALAGWVVGRVRSEWRQRGREVDATQRAVLLASLGSLIVYAIVSFTALWFHAEGGLDFWVSVAMLAAVTEEGHSSTTRQASS